MSKEKRIIDYYKYHDEDQRAASSRANQLEFHYTKKLLREHVASESHVIELGCGTGYYGMYFADKCAHFTGIDLSPENIKSFQNKIKAAGYKNVRASVGNALSLPELFDESFDVVLCLGPMYHLPRQDRRQVFRECTRMARKGAVLAFSYINSIGAYMGWCVNDEWRAQYPSKEANRYFLEYNRAHDNPDVFFLTSPEEMEEDARSIGLSMLKNHGVDYFFAQSAINRMSEEQFASYMEFADNLSESPSCAGLADHALMICRK